MATELTRRNVDSLRGMLDKSMPALRAVATKHMTPERLAKIVLSTVSRNHGLAECTPLSILRCVITSAQLGLDCSGILGEAYMVPFKNGKTGTKEAQFILGYRGLVGLARRTGDLEQVEARTVHEGDIFEWEFGIVPVFRHRPSPTPRTKETCTHAYAIWRMRGGGIHVDVMTIDELERIRRMSRAKDSGPWVDHPIEMYKKTVIRRSSKLVPMCAEMADALHAEDRSEAGLSPALLLTGGTDYDVVDETEEPLSQEEESQTQREVVEEKKVAGKRPTARRTPSSPTESQVESSANPKMDFETLWNEVQDLIRNRSSEEIASVCELANVGRISATLTGPELDRVRIAALKKFGPDAE